MSRNKNCPWKAMAVVGVLLGFVGMFAIKPTSAADYWPTSAWRRSMPEQQGMDSGRLADMLEHVRKEKITIDSITVVRNGYLVLDAYFHPLFKRGSRHIIHSCTKSVTSALMGIAIDKGYVKGVEEPVLGFFPEKTFSNMEKRKADIRVKHLLTMSHGIRTLDSFLFNWKGLFEMWPSLDWVQYILDLPMDVAPGERYDYSNMSSFLLSAIIQKRTGMTALEFAKKHLFEPIGIRNVKWASNTRGETTGWGGMWLTPYDMARFGWLYLNNGRWDGRQIVPEQWVKESIQMHAFPKKFRKVFDKDGDYLFLKSARLWASYNFWMPFTDGYGYQWWIDDSGSYSAVGHGGQFIMVIPDKGIVAVFTSVLGGNHFSVPGELLTEYILESVVSDNAIDPEPKKQKRLVDLLAATREDQEPEPEFVAFLNETAKRISGKSYRFEKNEYRYRNLSLTFKSGASAARYNAIIGFRVMNGEIGLDNIYRFSTMEGRRVGLKGRWINDNTFEMVYDHVAYTMRGKATLTFEGDRITYLVDDLIRGKFSVSGKME